MRSSAEARAAALLGRPVARAERIVGKGANNRIYRIEAGGERFALKIYPDDDRRGRLEHEWAALSFLAEDGERMVPRPLARDAGAALYEWIDGGRPPADAAAIDAMAAFLERLHDRRHRAAALPEAAEACFAEAEIVRQLRARHARLSEVTGEPELAALLARIRLPADADPTPLPAALRALSPSDFGLHNALAAPRGIVFLDFEYFGWDDPVKLVADVLWHPGMELAAPQAARFRAACEAVYGRGDAGFAGRLAARLPLFGLRWVLIILNEFLPERWALRAHAGAADQEAAKAAQAAKARRFLARVHELERSFG